MAVSLRVLLIDDSADDCPLAPRVLRHAGYDAVWERATTTAAALAALDAQSWDLIVAEQGLPGGIDELLTLIEERRLGVPVIVVADVVEEQAALEALRRGAGDFVHRDDVSRLALAFERELREARERRIRRKAEEALATARARQRLAEGFAEELNHRVKNNLAMMTGILQLQIDAEDPDSRVARALREAATRLQAIIAVQEELTADHWQEVNVLSALRRVAGASGQVATSGDVALSVEGDNLAYPSRAATNLCVVTNELITNAIKHGAPGADGRLHVEVRLACGGDRLCLTVTNSGNPVGANFDVTAHPGLGLRLVDDMVTSMYRGAFRLLPHADGTRAEVTIEDAKLRARRDP